MENESDEFDSATNFGVTAGRGRTSRIRTIGGADFITMPFRSQAQRKYLFARRPEIAKEFAEKTHNIKALPEKVKKRAAQVKALKRRLKK